MSDTPLRRVDTDTVAGFIDKVAWLRVEDGRVLATRSHGRTLYYLPGGEREPGETDLQTLTREVAEELTVTIMPETVTPVGTFEAQADAQPPGVLVRMACYAADYDAAGALSPSAEIAELAWLTYADRDRVSPVEQLVFDQLHATGELT
ncbi:8-oxo-dGTP pyrophosphatase MutT, NUDIX family [Micromonospora pattaloongensis]|uniref:8-oxo-dGTP pyrophosphatase MutT, NUDIX family n=1 Tax=Micromonospora pattaloongensis TaxID=405436 RepID=A0A1H3RJI9_9ACTN|nr:NUDIX domain-containing protein [Micromonospora pattaloongensis]SDZ25525.1 8-oxo-dGTP pyrophosphatase MutT, NUDIX family [Micromonospora pattaloongensis]